MKEHPRLEGATKLRSIATKFSVFTAALVFWVVTTMLAYDLRQENFDVWKGILLCVIVLLVAGAIAKFTIRMLVKPLVRLQAGITAVRNGQLTPVEVSRTGDEIEFLAESFNRTIAALAQSKEEIRRNQELVEERIRRRTEQLEESTLRAEAANVAKSEFLTNISHELRNPLAGTIGMLDLVLAGPLSPEQRDRLETAHQCTYSLLGLLNEIRDLSTLESGKIPLEKIPFDVRAVIDDCLRCHRLQAGHRGIDLRSEVATSMPPQIVGDPLRLRQILMSLLGNAVKRSEHALVVVRAAGEPVGQSEFRLQLEVQDSGPGNSSREPPHIFERLMHSSGGTGLELTITKKLVDICGGEITLENEPGAGTRFQVMLSCGVPAARAAANRCVASTAPAAQVGTARILIVEDNQVNQKVVSAVLRKRGFAVEIADDGREAIARLESSDFDLVLMDVQMPVLDGLEATRIIRKNDRWKLLPIVAMTAHAMSGDRDRCLDAGMTGYISKPVHPSHLLQTIEEHLVAAAARA